MLAPTPLVSDVPNRCQEDVPYGYNKNEVVGGDLDLGTCLACIWSMKAYAMAFQTTFDSNKKIVLNILNIIMMLKSLFGQDS